MSEVAADRREWSRDSLCSSIAERGRVAGAIKACFASIGFCGLAAVGPAFAQAPENGDELARMMIKQAESDGGRVDMHRFGDGACFVAEGLSAAYVARRQFPGYPVAYREADPGNGPVVYPAGGPRQGERQDLCDQAGRPALGRAGERAGR
jgi:hypothetical protein